MQEHIDNHTLPIPIVFFNDTTTTEIYTLSLHELFRSIRLHTRPRNGHRQRALRVRPADRAPDQLGEHVARSEEHTSELQSHSDLVCRLLLEKKNEVQEHTRRITTL